MLHSLKNRLRNFSVNSISLHQTFKRHSLQIFKVILAVRHFKIRQMIVSEFKFDIALLRNFLCVCNRFRNILKSFQHLFFALKIKLVGVELHPVLVLQSLSGCNRHKYFLNHRIFFVKIVAVVSCNNFCAGVFRKLHKKLLYIRFLLNAVVLNFKIKIVAESFFVKFKSFLCPLQIAIQIFSLNFTA